IVIEYACHSADISGRRIAGDQMLDQYLAYERSNVRMMEYIVEGLIQRRIRIVLTYSPCASRASGNGRKRRSGIIEQRLRGEVVIAALIRKDHWVFVVDDANRRVWTPDVAKRPAGEHLRKIIDTFLIVSGYRVVVSI